MAGFIPYSYGNTSLQAAAAQQPQPLQQRSAWADMMGLPEQMPAPKAAIDPSLSIPFAPPGSSPYNAMAGVPKAQPLLAMNGPVAQNLAPDLGASVSKGNPPPRAPKPFDLTPISQAGGEEPQSYAAMLQAIKERGDAMAAEQRRGADFMRQGLDPLMQGDIQTDLSPLAALVDTWSGSNLAKSYKAPETGQQRRQEIQGLQKGIANAGIQASATELDALKALADGTFGMEKYAAEQQYKKDSLAIQREQNAINRAKQTALAGGGAGGTPTKFTGLKKLNDEVAKEYNDFIVKGGSSSAQSQIQNLAATKQRMKSTPNFSGAWIGTLPEAARSKLYPNEFAIQEAVQESAGSSMKAALGGAFTEKEGARVLAWVYNPSLKPEENINRLDRLTAKLEGIVQAKQLAMEYFENNGYSMAGYDGHVPSMNDLREFYQGGGGTQGASNTNRQDSEALAWARNNPNSEYAQKIFEKNGVTMGAK